MDSFLGGRDEDRADVDDVRGGRTASGLSAGGGGGGGGENVSLRSTGSCMLGSESLAGLGLRLGSPFEFWLCSGRDSTSPELTDACGDMESCGDCEASRLGKDCDIRCAFLIRPAFSDCMLVAAEYTDALSVLNRLDPRTESASPLIMVTGL
jgi:hypothetical protein